MPVRFTKRKNKYNAIKVTDDGITFDSRAEHQRYCELKLLQRAGKISELAVHVRLPLKIAGKKICDYIADFTYVENNKPIIEDLKSRPTETPVFRLKAKMVAVCYSAAEFRIVRAR